MLLAVAECTVLAVCGGSLCGISIGMGRYWVLLLCRMTWGQRRGRGGTGVLRCRTDRCVIGRWCLCCTGAFGFVQGVRGFGVEGGCLGWLVVNDFGFMRRFDFQRRIRGGVR